jgi:hypothetical protein
VDSDEFWKAKRHDSILYIKDQLDNDSGDESTIRTIHLGGRRKVHWCHLLSLSNFGILLIVHIAESILSAFLKYVPETKSLGDCSTSVDVSTWHTTVKGHFLLDEAA